MTTYARQAEVLKVTREEGLEGYFYLIRTREAKADKYPDLVEARLEAAEALDGLATIEQAYGAQSARDSFLGAVAKARAKLREQGAA